MGGRSAVGAAVVVWLGLLAGGALGGPWTAAAAAAALGAAALSLRAPPRTGSALAMLALAGAALARGGAHAAAFERSRDGLGGEAALHRLEARVLGPPERESGEPVVVVAALAATPPLRRGVRLRLRLPPGTACGPGDRVALLARLERPAGRRNPGGYDAAAAARAHDVAGVGRAHVARVAAARGPAAAARATTARWRAAIDRRLARLEPGTRELVVPLVTGDRSGLSPELSARFKASGLVHLLALSGLHVTWMAEVARGAVAALGGGPGPRAAAGALCAAFYVGIAGPIPSLMRAALTEALRAAALGRALDPVQALALAALALLAAAPGWAEDLGFQLSCAATLGLVALAPLGGSGRLAGLRHAIAATLGAQLAALPLLLARFHAASWIAPLANLPAVPISGLLLTAAWIGLAADLALPGLGRPWFSACEALAPALRRLTEASGGLTGALAGTGHHPLPVALAALGALLLVAAAPDPRGPPAGGERRARPAALLGGLALVALSLATLAAAPPLRPPPGRVWLVVLDVGQGDALALGFEDGWWLVDAGPRSPRHDAGESVVLPFLRWAGVRRLETLAITHDDGDHAGGAAAVARGVRVAARLAPWRAGGSSPRLPGRAAARGDLLRAAPRVQVLWPPRDRVARGDNAASLVLEVGVDPGRLLLLADIDSVAERGLAAAPGVALLKVAHHGSGSSSGSAFLARARPRRAAISCGRRNPFGHPDPGTLRRLEAAGARVERTDREGALWYEAGPEGVRRIDWRRGAPGPPPPRPAPASAPRP